MTIKNAFQNFIFALTGQKPVGTNIADVINDGANKVSAITGNSGSDLSELNTAISTINSTLATLDGTAIKHDGANKSFVLASSTADSTKEFTITVVDNGTIAATEVVAESPADP